MLADAATVGLLFFLGFIGLGVAVLAVLRYWLVEGTLDTAPALGVLGVVLVGSATVVKTASPILLLLWVVALVGGALVVPLLADAGEKRALNSLFEDDIVRYQRAIARDATNAAAWREMGELYLKMNRYDAAIAAYKEALKLNPHDADRIRRRLNQALDYKSGMRDTSRVICESCKLETTKGTVCTHCGEKLDVTFLEWFFQAQNVRVVLKPAAAITAGVVAALTVFSTLPAGLKVAVILCCLLTGGYLIWRAVQEGD